MRGVACVAVLGVLVLASAARAQERLFFEAELLSDERWGEVVSRDPVFEPGGYLSGTNGGSATVSGGPAAGASAGRQSIDVDVVAAIVAERARQVAMHAVADVLEQSGGDALRRRYVRDLVDAATALLEDRAGMQRTHVERIASILVRAVLAEALVEMRFPTRSTSVDPCHWRRAVFSEPSADQTRRGREYHRREGAHLGRSARESFAEFCATAPFGAAVADAPADSLPDGAACELIARDRTGPTPAGTAAPRARLACELRAARTGRAALGVREWRPWLPPPRASAAKAATMRAYLVDLAYAWLSRSELFRVEVAAPECPFEAEAEYAGLCRFVAADGSEPERAERIAWLFGLERVLDGLRLAQALRPFLQQPAEQRLRTFLGAYLERPDLGSFRDTRALRPAHWRELGQVEAAADYWLALRLVAQRVKAFVQEHTADGAQVNPAELKTAVQAAVRARTALCARSAQEIGERPCAQAEWNAWLDGVAEGSAIREAVTAPRGESRRRLLRIPETLDPILIALERDGTVATRALERVKTSAAELRRLTDELGDGVAWEGRHRVADVRLVELGPIAAQLGRVHAALDALDTALADAGLGGLLDWLRSERTAVAAADQVVGAAFRFFELLRRVHGTTLTTGGGRITVGGAMHALRALARRTVHGDLQTPLLDRLGPVIADVCIGEPIPLDGLLLVLDRIPSQRIVIALGAATREADWCARDESGFACWSLRIVQALREATDVRRVDGEESIRVDGARLTQTLAALGDDYRRRREWRWYFHLTIGLGNMVSYLPPDPAAERTESDVRLVPTVTEQIGLGYASPAIGENVLAFRFGFFASGILYRIVLDSEESDAVMFGLFAAADLYELLELYVAPAILVHPPEGEDSLRPTWGLSFGAQVPLGDYLARL